MDKKWKKSIFRLLPLNAQYFLTFIFEFLRELVSFVYPNDLFWLHGKLHILIQLENLLKL